MIKKITIGLATFFGAVSLSASTYSYNLSSGWNTIAVPVNLGSSSVDSFITEATESKVTKIWGKSTTGSWISYTPGLSALFNKLDTFTAGGVYYVNLNDSSSFTVTGDVYSEQNLSLSNGWNTVGVFDSNISITEFTTLVTESNIGKIWGKSSTGSWISYTPGLSSLFNKLDTLEPTKVYYINMKDLTGTLTVDFANGSSALEYPEDIPDLNTSLATPPGGGTPPGI